VSTGLARPSAGCRHGHLHANAESESLTLKPADGPRPASGSAGRLVLQPHCLLAGGLLVHHQLPRRTFSAASKVSAPESIPAANANGSAAVLRTRVRPMLAKLQQASLQDSWIWRERERSKRPNGAAPCQQLNGREGFVTRLSTDLRQLGQSSFVCFDSKSRCLLGFFFPYPGTFNQSILANDSLKQYKNPVKIKIYQLCYLQSKVGYRYSPCGIYGKD
jgi:hypothetical protein